MTNCEFIISKGKPVYYMISKSDRKFAIHNSKKENMSFKK